MSDGTPSVTTAPDAGVRRFPLPPVGSTPSAPVRGERVFSLEACGGPSSVAGWSGNLVLYADGRLLWHTFADPPEGRVTPSPTTSWLEQRLTPEGVELMRSELAASGLPFHGVFDYCPTDSYLLKTGDRSHERYFVGALPDELVERISDPASWLPSRAWEDRRVRPFVPARYGVCLSGEDPRIDMTRLADSLPAPVGDLVRARSWGGNHYGPSRWLWCSTGTTDSARTFIEAIEAAGLDPSEQQPMGSLVWGPEYQFDYQHGERSELIQLSFHPELPDDSL
jgi:hypothetical protein